MQKILKIICLILKSFNTQVVDLEPKYVPSLVGSCCSSQVGDVVKYHSDIHLLLHQKNLADKIGIDNVRQYLNDINSNFSAPDTLLKDLSDEQLIEVTKDRRFNTITDNYEFQQILASDYQSIVKESNERLAYKAKIDAEKQKLSDLLSSNNK